MPRSAFILSSMILYLPIAGFSDDSESPIKTEQQIALNFWGSKEEAVIPLAFEEQKEEEKQEENWCEAFRSRLQIGGDYTFVHLKVHGNSSFNGSLGGAQASYEYRPLNNFYAAAKLSWKEGKPTGATGSRAMIYADSQERLGYTFACKNETFSLSLFSGLGFRYLNENYVPKVGSSIRFKYKEFYVPVGLLSNYDCNCLFSIGLNLTWMPQVFPTVALVPLKGTNWTLSDTLENYYVELPLTFNLTKDKKYQITLNPFWEHWNDGSSEAALPSGITLGLPGNTYNFYGVDVNFGFSF